MANKRRRKRKSGVSPPTPPNDAPPVAALVPAALTQDTKPPGAPVWRTGMAIGGAAGVAGLLPANAFVDGWTVGHSFLLIVGCPILFTILDLIRLTVQERLSRTTVAQAQAAELLQSLQEARAELMRELQSARAQQQALLTMLAVTLHGVESSATTEADGGGTVTSRPVVDKPRPRRSRQGRKKLPPKDNSAQSSTNESGR